MAIVKDKRIIALPTKVSWIILTLYFVFDNVVSYIAITRMGGRELNAVIAPLVETYPLLYFLCIPAEIIGIYLIVLLLREVTAVVMRHWKFFDKAIIERIILTAVVIHWAIANSSFNLAFLLGFRNVGYLWGTFTLVGFVAALIYGFLSLYLVSRKK